MKARLLLLCVVIFLPAFLGAQQPSETPAAGILQVGLGYAVLNYPSALNDAIQTAQSLGLQRIPICIELSGGWAILNNAYLMGGVTGFGDRLYDPSNTANWMQINMYLFELKLKYYPMMAGLSIEGGAGITSMVVDSPAATINSNPGVGASAGVSYDFAPKMAQGGMQLGADVVLLSIEQEMCTGIGVFFKYAWK